MQAADRAFDAVVVGEYERAFQGRQLDELTSILRRCGVAWLGDSDGDRGVASYARHSGAPGGCAPVTSGGLVCGRRAHCVETQSKRQRALRQAGWR